MERKAVAEDLSTYWIDTDETGPRFKAWRKVVLESKQETYSDSVVSQPGTALTVCGKMLQNAGDPKRWFAEWARELSIGRKERAWHEMHTLRDIFFHASWPPGFHTTTGELHTCTFEGPGASNTTKIPREHTQRERQKERKWSGRVKKESEILGLPPFGALPHPSRPDFFLGLGPISQAILAQAISVQATSCFRGVCQVCAFCCAVVSVTIEHGGFSKTICPRPCGGRSSEEPVHHLVHGNVERDRILHPPQQRAREGSIRDEHHSNSRTGREFLRVQRIQELRSPRPSHRLELC